MLKFNKVFSNKCAIIGMIHVDALPGTPKYNGQFNQCIERARHEANIYKNHKIDGILLENMHDIPYIQSNRIGPEITACMTRLCLEVKRILSPNIACGIQILACGNHQALAIAKATDLQFIRAEGFIFSHIADEGFTDAQAGKLLRYRKQIDADNILIFTDLKKKHCSHAITVDVSLSDTAEAAEFFLTDGIILTGNATGKAVDINDVQGLLGKLKTPVLLGSGVTIDNIQNYYKNVNGAIIGSHFKEKGCWTGELCSKTVEAFMNKIHDLRESKNI